MMLSKGLHVRTVYFLHICFLNVNCCDTVMVKLGTSAPPF